MAVDATPSGLHNDAHPQVSAASAIFPYLRPGHRADAQRHSPGEAHVLGSSVLDIGIGLIFVYLMVSLVCTAANEALASLLSWRGNNLREGIRNLLDGPNPSSAEWAEKLYGHPLIQGLYKEGQKPSYIPSRTFALALTDLVLPGDLGARDSTGQELRDAIAASPCTAGLKQVLRLLVDEADRSNKAGKELRLAGVLDIQKLDSVFNQLQQHIEIWFNNSMERVSGWYKRRVQYWTITIAVCLTGALNVDSVLIARRLARDSALRSVIVAQAEQMVQQPPATVVVNATPPAAATASPVQDTSARVQLLQDRIQELKTVGIPLGWPDPDGPPRGVSWFLLKILGLLLTAGAASLGAPFWFDVLNRFMSVRSAGKAPEEAPKSPKQIPFPAPPGQPQGSTPPTEAPAKPIPAPPGQPQGSAPPAKVPEKP
jgi:hypothetical protein